MKQFSAKSKLSFQFLFICLVLTGAIYGCRKDSGHFGNTESASVLAKHGVDLSLLQNAYRVGTSASLKVNSVNTADLSKIIGTLNVDWDTYTLFNNPDSSQLVEFDMPEDNSLLIPGNIAVSDSAKYHAKTKAVFIVRQDTVRLSFFMKVIEESTTVGYQPVLGQVHYKRIPLGFTGKILYFTLGRQFINGYTWDNGSISKTLAISATIPKQQQTQSTGNNKIKTNVLSCTSETYEVWAIRIFSDGTIAWDEHLYDIVVTKCTSDGGGDDGSGGSGGGTGGGTGGGSGGVTGDDPPQKCIPASPPAVESIKGKIIINVYEGGGTGGGGTGGSTPPLCPTVPGPSTNPMAPTTQIITNNINNPCLKNMVNTTILKGVSTQINTLIKDVFDANTKVNLNFVDVTTLPVGDEGYTPTSHYDSNGNLNEEIQLNANSLPNSSQQYIASVIMHEALHAYLDSKGVADNLQHDEIITYVTQMAASLQKMFPTLSDVDSKSLSLGGLWMTDSYKKSIAIDMQLSGQYDAIRSAYSLGVSGTKCQ